MTAHTVLGWQLSVRRTVLKKYSRCSQQKEKQPNNIFSCCVVWAEFCWSDCCVVASLFTVLFLNIRFSVINRYVFSFV